MWWSTCSSFTLWLSFAAGARASCTASLDGMESRLRLHHLRTSSVVCEIQVSGSGKVPVLDE